MTKRVGYMLWTLGCVGAWLYLGYWMVLTVGMMVRMEPLSRELFGFHMHHMGVFASLSLLWFCGMRVVHGPNMSDWP